MKKPIYYIESVRVRALAQIMFSGVVSLEKDVFLDRKRIKECRSCRRMSGTFVLPTFFPKKESNSTMFVSILLSLILFAKHNESRLKNNLSCPKQGNERFLSHDTTPPPKLPLRTPRDWISLPSATILDRVKWNTKPPSPLPRLNQWSSSAKAKTRHFSHPWFGGEGGVQIFHLFCPRLQVFFTGRRCAIQRGDGPNSKEKTRLSEATFPAFGKQFDIKQWWKRT